ncbi:kinetochore protein mis14 [Aspergillus nomiae NRRL 13137]|uniref:Kinetochore protein mis14 n=1 Tax=Aspergillus nomiae NRRL (strain ATCC 15546 / NRRL 13137 / CBS 260.88 / M93) TaxID=1509407 RepID=A0A0L1IXP8_ASPN3|nr:kinetochore protein mis14 [Aspergillus nomiae NRRL 13137]KNG84282.1 kinetochore protein mis14 [Aspergillus nomiae NRRL 13137]
MGESMHRKIELQAPADFTYLYGNTVALSRQKLDLHLPPSANPEDGPDPMRERVRELVDEYILRTFTSASSSISINGLDSSSPQFPFPAAFTAPAETVEYEPYDGHLASRVTSLYAQLESLTTTVAQLRRDAPRRAAETYAAELKKVIEEDEHDDLEDEILLESGEDSERQTTEDVDMPDADQNQKQTANNGPSTNGSRRRSAKTKWDLHVPLGTDHEAELWRTGEMAEVYEDTLRTLLRLQGEAIPGDETNATTDGAADGNAVASTVGKAERASRAVEVVEKK